jgi:hypothetical protein
VKSEDAELLSRLMDGDLDDATRRRLEARLATETSLSEELVTLRTNREAVAELARRMAPPPQLDLVVEPLRSPGGRGPRPSRRLWLATAAAALLLAAGALLLTHRSRPLVGETTVARSRPVESLPEEREMFQLSPLPTSPIPEDEQPLGAADRLLARPLPDPPLAEPEPLEVLGPLEAPPATTSRGGSREMVLRIPSQDVTRPIEAPQELLEARPLLRLEIAVSGGRITDLSVDPPPTETTGKSLRDLLIGLRMAGLVDGTYRAEILPEGGDGPTASR